MAICWPRKLPQEILRDPRRKAEIMVYERLCAELDDDFHVYYSSPWLGTDHLGQEKDGECDFVVAHEKLGLLFIEVKGGSIDFDPATGEWTSTDGHGFEHRIKDPVQQARSAKHQLLKKLNASTLWQARWIHAVHGVIFPAAGTPPEDLGADRPAKLFCCSHQFRRGLRAWVGQRMGETCGAASCQPLGQDGLSALNDIIAKPLSLHYTMAARVSEAEVALQALTPRQFHIIENIADIDRAEVRGGAGTGKTVIAMAEAGRAANSGRRTLLTCKSRPLAHAMRRALKDIPNLDVRHFHSLCSWLAKEAWIELPECSDEQQLFDELFPAAMIKALEKRPELRWQEVVVDEGQDFRPAWWAAIEAALEPDARLRVFSDSNQAVYGSRHCPPGTLSLVPIRLSHNLRNTAPIHDAASVHYSGHLIEAHGPEGVAVEWRELPVDAAIPGAIAERLRQLIRHEEIDPADIAILFPLRAQVDAFRRACSAEIPTADCESAGGSAAVDTIHRFKGLERPVVLVGIPTAAVEKAELAYVALSRARSHLEVFGTSPTLQWIRGQVDRVAGEAENLPESM